MLSEPLKLKTNLAAQSRRILSGSTLSGQSENIRALGVVAGAKVITMVYDRRNQRLYHATIRLGHPRPFASTIIQPCRHEGRESRQDLD